MGTPSPACCFSFYLLCPVLSGVLCGKFHYSCDVKQRLLQPSCSLYSFSALVYHKEHGIGKVLARSSWCFSQCQMYFSLFHFCLDCSLFKAESSLPVSGPWGHHYLVAMTSNHPHIFCPVIQELYFRLCLRGCLCPHLHWTCLVSQPTPQSCFHSFLCPWPLLVPTGVPGRTRWITLALSGTVSGPCWQHLLCPTHQTVGSPGWWGHCQCSGHPQLAAPSPMWNSPAFAACWLGNIWHERVFLQF